MPIIPTIPMNAEGAGIGNLIAAKRTPTKKPAIKAFISSIISPPIQVVYRTLRNSERTYLYR